MTLDNDTTLRGYLTHLHANVRKLTRLYGERTLAGGAATRSETVDAMALQWEKLRIDLQKIMDLDLVPFPQLAHSRYPWGAHDVGQQSGTKDITRVRFSVLKKMADKARRRDPTITLLKSWDLEAHKPYSRPDDGGLRLVP